MLYPPAKFERELQPVIPFADESNLDEEALAVLGKAGAMLGVVPNAARTYANRPEIARAIHPFYHAIVLSEQSTLDAALKIKLGVICSSVNGCVYCTSHQCSLAQADSEGGDKWGLSNEDLLALISGEDEGNGDVERLCFEFARTASFSPSEVELELLERMKEHMTSAQIVELGCVVAMWKFFNTMHDSLHIPSEQVMSRYTGFIDAGRK